MTPLTALRLVAGAGAALSLFFAVVAARSPLAGALRRGEPVAGLLLGTDLAENAPHSDTLMVWRFAPRAGRLDILSIPRDTKIDLPGYRFHRINEVFAYHFASTRDVDRAAREVMAAVQQVLPGLDALDPRYYFQVDFEGFTRVIDRLGGVTVTVDQPMHYDDNAGNFHFHREPGVYHMNGRDALGYARYRGKSGDRGRILRQMEFFQALARRGTSPAALWRWPGALSAAAAALHSNVRARELPFLLMEAKRLRATDINPWWLPGRVQGAYWEVNPALASFVLSQISAGGTPAPPEEPVDTPPAGPAPVRGATVKVWNASGRAGLALAVARDLRRAGFDVVEWGTYNARQTTTRVVDRSGRFERAQAVAARLEVRGPYSDADPVLRTDVEVVLGEDFTPREP